MQQQPRVSVIIPFLNGGDWLAEAIESVLEQTYTNWELILVDDGSLEDHSRVAKSYSAKYPKKIVYTDHPNHINKGVTISRNVGISLTTGEYIALLDADDYWLPQKLQHQVNLFKIYTEAAMICEASRMWYSWQNPSEKDIVMAVGLKDDTLFYPPQLMYDLYPLGEGASACPSGIMFTRKAFDRSGGFEACFTGIYQGYEDQGFLAKMYLNEIVFISGTANNLYRKRHDSMSSFVNNVQLYNKVRNFFLNWLEAYLKKHLVENSKVNDLIKKARQNMID